MLKLLLFLLSSIFILSSCDRAMNTETTRLNIELPASANSYILNQNSNFMRSLNVNILNLDTEYLEILPTGFGSGVAPVNCYFVTVTGPEDFMNVNYCGKVDSNGQLTKDHTFGTHVGYVSSASNLAVDVPSGKNRVVKLFGFHVTSVDECKDTRDEPARNAMSFPYYVGKSAETNLDGTTKVVTVQLETPVSTNRMDDCKINFENSIADEANSIGVDISEFPYGYARIPASVGFTCELVKFSLFNGGIDKKPAALLLRSNYNFEISTDGTNYEARDLYATYNACQSNFTGSPSFSIAGSRDRSDKWIRLLAGDGNITHYRASSVGRVDITATASPMILNNSPSVTQVFDLIGMPKNIVNGQCYPFRIGFRDLYGQFPLLTASTNVSIHTKLNGTTISSGFFTDPGCTAFTAGPVTLPSNQSLSSTVYYMQLNIGEALDGRLAEFEVIRNSGGPGGLVSTTKIPFRLIFNATNTPVLSKINFSALKYIATNGSDRCVPLVLNLLDQNGLPFVTDGSQSMEILQESITNMQGVTIFSNKECTTTAIIGDPAVLGVSDTQVTYFLGVSSTVSVGPRKAVFTTNTSVVKEFFFNIIDK